jgi:hypothetical protein
MAEVRQTTVEEVNSKRQHLTAYRVCHLQFNGSRDITHIIVSIHSEAKSSILFSLCSTSLISKRRMMVIMVMLKKMNMKPRPHRFLSSMK